MGTGLAAAMVARAVMATMVMAVTTVVAGVAPVVAV
jgi:hypothetical protein